MELELKKIIIKLKKFLSFSRLPVLPADPDSFRHATSSCHGRLPKRFKYQYIRPENKKNLPYLLLENSNILRWRKYSASFYFGWISESSEIIKELIQKILDNLQTLENNFTRIFTSDERLISFSPIFERAPNGSTLPWVQQIPVGFNKTQLLSIVASTKNQTEGHRLREEAIKKFNPLDVFGRGRREIKKKEEALWPYYFSVVIENASYSKYFTEKLTDCFISKTVPIYWGDPCIGEIFNSKGILDFNKVCRRNLSISLYKDLTPVIEENFKKTLTLDLPDDIIFQKIQSNLKQKTKYTFLHEQKS